MKVIIDSKENIIKKAQKVIDSYPDGSTIALAYNNDTKLLTFNNKRVVEVMDSNDSIASQFDFEVKTSEYDGSHIDLAVLGIGYKGQIGFNEIATPFDSETHIQKLTTSTVEEYSEFGLVDLMGITMGIKTLVSADEIIVVATGEKRASAVFGMLYGRNDSSIPAAFLQIHREVTVFADHEAAKEL